MNTRRMQCIGEHLRKERRIRDKTLEQVADAVGLKKNTISAYEKERFLFLSIILMRFAGT